MSGASVIYHKLQEHKVKDVFMYSGGSIMPLIDQFQQGKINYYVNTHEQLADILTKPLDEYNFQCLRKMLLSY